jgi:hypothetical protein
MQEGQILAADRRAYARLLYAVYAHPKFLLLTRDSLVKKQR